MTFKSKKKKKKVIAQALIKLKVIQLCNIKIIKIEYVLILIQV
jgi:hypothetical protein